MTERCELVHVPHPMFSLHSAQTPCRGCFAISCRPGKDICAGPIRSAKLQMRATSRRKAQ